MKLSDRLQLIAGEIGQGETMADIGTDHGFLPIYLKTKGICPKVILTDISVPSLQKAIDDCERLSPDENYEFRAGDGIKVLAEGEVDDIVIAGMGGILITEILAAKEEVSHALKKIILQPRSQVGLLRKWLSENGYSILREHLVREGRYIPNILVCCYTGKAPSDEEGFPKLAFGSESCEGERGEDESFYEYPDAFLSMDGPLVEEFLERAKEKHLRILAQIGENDPLEARRQKACLTRIESLLQKRGR